MPIAISTGFILGLLFFAEQHRFSTTVYFFVVYQIIVVCLIFAVVCEDCSQTTIASSKWQVSRSNAELVVTLDGLHVVHKISISGSADAFFLSYVTSSRDDWRQYLDENGLPQVSLNLHLFFIKLLFFVRLVFLHNLTSLIAMSAAYFCCSHTLFKMQSWWIMMQISIRAS